MLPYNAPAKFEVAMFNSFGEDAIARNMTYRPIDRQIDNGQTLVPWYQINIAFFSKEKAGIKMAPSPGSHVFLTD